MIRPAIPNKTRFSVFKRDNFTCQYCGRSASDGAKLVIDHIYPVALGGINDEDNYITACCECNSSKRDYSLNDEMSSDVEVTGFAYGLTKLSIDMIHRIAREEKLTFYDTSKLLVRHFFKCIDGIEKPHNYFFKLFTEVPSILELWRKRSAIYEEKNGYGFNEFERYHAQVAFDEYTYKKINDYCEGTEINGSQFLTMFFDFIGTSYGMRED